jgi:chitinase
MSTLRKSLSYILAGSILLAGAACERSAPSITSPGSSESASFAKKPPAPPADTTPPTVPVLTATSVGTRYITLVWHSTDNSSQYISYRVTKDGVPITSSGLTWVSETSRTFTLLQPGTTYTFTAQARDSYVNVSTGNVSAVSAPFAVTTKVDDGSDVTAPTQPSNVQAFGYGDLEMQVWWGASTDNVTPANVIIYEIYVNGALENTAIGTNMTPSAYGVSGHNVVTVVAIDEAGNRSVAGTTSIDLP